MTPATPPRAGHSVEEARERYAWWRDLARFHADRSDCGAGDCHVCHSISLETDAASIVSDLVNAEAAREMTRRSVAW